MVHAPALETTEITNWAVDLIGVRKTYAGKIEALKGVNVQVGRGEIFGLLGPNGAGKSTLVKIMMTVVRPNAAMGTVLGRPLGNRRKLALVGYLPEDHRFPSYLTGAQVLDHFARLARVPRDLRQKRAKELLERVNMTAWADKRVSKYSKGMLQRLGLAQALMNDPELIVLDEPTDGLDPMGRRDVRELLIEYKRRGKTIFINSHLLSELEMVCDRVSILVNGWVARQGALDELTEQSREYRIVATTDLSSVASQLTDLGGTVSGKEVTIPGHDQPTSNKIIDLLRGNGIQIELVEPKRFSLEEVFVETLGGTGRATKARPTNSSTKGGTN